MFGGKVTLCEMVKFGVRRLLRIGAGGICVGSATVRAIAQNCIDGKRASNLAPNTCMMICLDTCSDTGVEYGLICKSMLSY